MKIIVLDFFDANVKIIQNIPQNIKNNDYEEYLLENYNLKSSQIEYMIVDDLKIEML